MFSLKLSLTDVAKSVVDRLDSYTYNSGVPNRKQNGRHKKSSVEEEKKADDITSMNEEACCAICLDDYKTGEVRYY